MRPGRATPPDDTRGCHTPAARGAAWRSEPSARPRPPARRDPPAGRGRGAAGSYSSLREQGVALADGVARVDRKSTRLNSSHLVISYAVFCLKKKKERRA